MLGLWAGWKYGETFATTELWQGYGFAQVGALHVVEVTVATVEIYSIVRKSKNKMAGVTAAVLRCDSSESSLQNDKAAIICNDSSHSDRRMEIS